MFIFLHVPYSWLEGLRVGLKIEGLNLKEDVIKLTPHIYICKILLEQQ